MYHVILATFGSIGFLSAFIYLNRLVSVDGAAAVTRCDAGRGRRRCAQLSPSASSASVSGRRAAQSRRGDGVSGRVRRRQGREHQLRPGRLLQAPPDHPTADVLGKPPLQRAGRRE